MLLDIVIGLAILALLIARQLRTRKVNGSWRIVVILAIIGVVQASEFLKVSHATSTTYAALGGSLVLAAVFGGFRAITMRIWTENGETWVKGNWLTAGLWVLAVAAHLGYDYLVAPAHANGKQDIGTATVVLYLTVSLGVQRVITIMRARRLEPAGPSAGFGPVGGLS